MTDLAARAARIRLVMLDVDGTLTDGRLYFGNGGEELKAFHVHDGLGIKLLRQHGIELALVTARHSALVQRRAAELGIAHLDQGCADKREALQRLCTTHALEPGQVAVMGDDLGDLPALALAGLACAPANAHPWVAARVHWQSHARGGEGAVRELCDLLLAAQGHAERLLAGYLPQ
jgi:3-deoxy-D-manno-octulosonate 8-phosphate phosphatase (KDO 8-P phosphatase)